VIRAQRKSDATSELMSREWERRILSKRKVKRFSDLTLCEEAWFRAADDLIEAMALLEPRIKDYWQKASSQLLDANNEKELPPLGLVNVNMMLAGFAVENLCKGFLAARLTKGEKAQAKAGMLPKSLKTHDILALVEQVGMSVSETDRYLLERLGEAVWRGRYAIPIVHDQIKPFAQFDSDVRRIRALFRRLRRHVGTGR
jgi:hypothetical protein